MPHTRMAGATANPIHHALPVKAASECQNNARLQSAKRPDATWNLAKIPFFTAISPAAAHWQRYIAAVTIPTILLWR